MTLPSGFSRLATGLLPAGGQRSRRAVGATIAITLFSASILSIPSLPASRAALALASRYALSVRAGAFDDSSKMSWLKNSSSALFCLLNAIRSFSVRVFTAAGVVAR